DVHVTHSFETANRRIVDCFPILEQPSIKDLKGAARTIDRQPPRVFEAPHGVDIDQKKSEFPARRSIDITLKPGVRDARGNERFCRGDTIPLLRITLDDLTRFPSLEAFFRKGETREGRNIPADENHYYARGVQFVANFGADSWLNVWSPAVV